jgi:Calcineurin-like phosphoesterase
MSRPAMNVLAPYDIHGNVDTLEAGLADPRAADPGLVVVGGDAVPGPFASATLDRLEALSVPVRWIRGNGERAQALGDRRYVRSSSPWRRSS